MSLLDTAIGLVEGNGEQVILTAPLATPSTNPVTGEAQAPSAAVSYTVDGVPTRYKAHEVDGEFILAEDTRLITAFDAPFEPKAGWSALLDGETYRVMNAQRIRKLGENILFIVQLRRN